MDLEHIMSLKEKFEKFKKNKAIATILSYKHFILLKYIPIFLIKPL